MPTGSRADAPPRRETLPRAPACAAAPGADRCNAMQGMGRHVERAVGAVDAHASPVRGLAARRSAPFAGRRRGALAMPPFGFFSGASPVASARRLADRRGATGAAHPRSAAHARGPAASRRLGVGLRLFRRRPVVARLGLPGRGRPVRLGYAVRRARPAGRARPSSRPSASPWRACSGRPAPAASALAVGLTLSRMAARPSVHRLSLEHARHGARRRTAWLCSRRVARRAVRPDPARRPDRRRPATLGTGSTGARPLARPRRLRALRRSRSGRLRGAGGCPPAEVAHGRGVRLRIMQPNLPQDAKFRPENRERSCGATSAERARDSPRIGAGIADVTHLIWPESAFPFLLHRDPQALAQIAALLPPGVDADHRRGARGRGPAGRERPSLLQRHPGRRRRRHHPRHLRQGATSCRSASTCPFSTVCCAARASPVRARSGRVRAERAAHDSSGARPAARGRDDLL